MWWTITKILKNVCTPPSSCMRYSTVSHWMKVLDNNHRFKSGHQNGVSCRNTSYTAVCSSNFQLHKHRTRVNPKFEKFRSEVNKQSEDYVLCDEEWDRVRKEILDEDEAFAKGLDYSVMLNLHGKPDLSLSYMNYLRKNTEINTSTMVQFCINCVDKYEDSVVEVIQELKKIGYFEKTSLSSFEKFLKAVLKTNEWRLCLDTLHHIHEGRITVLFLVLKTALQHKEYQTFLDVWNQFHRYIVMHGNLAGESIFESWEEGEYPLDVLFEVSKLGEIPFAYEQSISLMNYCRNQWHEVVEAKIARVSNSRGQCLDCKTMMPVYDPMDVKKIKEFEKGLIDKVIYGRSIFEKTHPAELKRFFMFMEKQEKPFDLVVDALNVRPSYKMNLGLSNSFDFVKNLSHLGWNILMVTKKTNSSYVQEWLSYAQVFDTEISSSDDLYFLLGTLMSGPNCYLLTSDMLRDHSSKLDDSIRGYFCKWLEQRKITFKQRSNQVMWPPKHQWRTHETDSGWHIPYVKDMKAATAPNRSEELIKLRSRAFLCLTKKKYVPSEECLHFRQVKDSFFSSIDTKTGR